MICILVAYSFKNTIDFKKAKSIINYKYLYLKTISSSSEKQQFPIENIIEKQGRKFWVSDYSNNVGEVVEIDFLKKYYIKDIKINLYSDEKYSLIEKIELYDDEKYLGKFEIDNKIEINDSISSLSFVVKEVDNHFLINFYNDSTNYQFHHKTYNKPCKINFIEFTDDENNIYKTILLKKIIPLKKNISINYEYTNQQIINFSEENKSVLINDNCKIYSCFENSTEKIFLICDFSIIKNNENNLKLQAIGKLYISNNFVNKKEEFEGKILISEEKISVDTIFSIFCKIPDNYFVRVADLDSNIIMNIKYSTENNFTNTKLYDCNECLLRARIAEAIVEVSKFVNEKGYKVMLFDCYRPHSVQYKMWEVLPNINYVANPEKGSIHNRGGAIDVTFTDMNNNEIDMGTEFDFFGYEAYHSYEFLPDSIQKNRLFLKNTLEDFGFKAIKTEWWHYSHYSCLLYEISDFSLPCKKE